MHWHPNADEWSFFIRGRARDMGHFVENIGDEPLEMLEIFRADAFRDFSLFQWMGETPKKMVIDHLFAHDAESGEKFWQRVRGAEKDEITRPDAVEGGRHGEPETEEL
ncbi:Oxalate decarboxylase OxdC [Colletotrichum trifolii]|uniref:Oxalate decarboxylase OxdC n=1 Tax=Colletotrichum trifolii TaxID=5466 RepID=A0A4R8RP46_COLTR|nr:Oxalate decarboxylase OxdC [Colletotrichum trifolii]